MVAKPRKSTVIKNLLIIISGVMAMVMEYLEYLSVYRLLKPLTTILVIALLVCIPKANWSIFRKIVVLAMSFCLLGDIVLLFPEYFVFGLASFLVAHLLFIWGFVHINGFQRNLSSLVLFLGTGGLIFYWLWPGLGDFLVPVAIYILVICTMAWQGIGLYLKHKRKEFGWIAVAVLCFMFSDTMIAISKFKTAFAYSGIVVLSSYWLSIGLIANAARSLVLRPSE